MLTTDQLHEQIENLRKQEAALEAQAQQIMEQLAMTRGAIQMCDHLLTLADPLQESKE